MLSNEQDQIEVMVVAFRGKYRSGSFGNGDGRLMAAITHAAIAGWLPSGLLIDLREVEYEFGNTLIDCIDAGRDQSCGWYVPTRIIVADKSKRGVESLLTYLKRDPKEWVFSTMEEALHHLLDTICND